MNGWDWALVLAVVITVANIVVTIINVRLWRFWKKVK